MPYTIVRPGGLINSPGGETEVVFAQGDGAAGAIPRADVARVCVEALETQDALNKTFEINSGKQPPAGDMKAKFASLESD